MTRAVRAGGWRAQALLGAAWAAGGRGLAFLGFAGTAAVLPLSEWGAFAQARSVVLLLGPVLSLGLAATLMARLPAMVSAGDGAGAAGRLALGWGACLAVGAACGAVWIALGGPPGAAAALPAYGALFFGAQAARALGRPGWAYAPLGVGTLGGLALGVSGFGAGGLGGVEAAAWGWAAGLWAAALVQGGVLAARLPPPAVAQGAATIAEAAPLSLSLLARGAALQGPMAAAPFWLSAEAAGLAGWAMLAAQPALMALTGVSGALGPEMSRAEGRRRGGGAAAARRMARAGAAAAGAAGAAGAAALWLRAGPEAGAAAVWLAAAAVAMAVEAPVGLRLIAQGRARAETGLQALGAVAAGAAAAVLIPSWGPAGVGAAAFAGAAARALACRTPPWRARGADPAEAVATPGRAADPDLAPPPRGWAETRAALRADHARLGRPRRRFGLDLLTHKTFRAVASARLERAARTSRGPARALIPAAALWRRRCTLSLGCEIAWQAEIGPGLRLLHGFGVVILPCARIGAGATLAHGATVGYRAAPERPDWPRSLGEVCDGAFAGPYAIVWARLGPGAVLAPHSLLREPVPAGWTAAGAPARALRPIGGAARDAEAAAVAAE